MHCKSSSGSFSDSPCHPRTMGTIPSGLVWFFWHSFPRDLGQTLSSQHRNSSHLHSFQFYQCCSGRTNRNHPKFHPTPGLDPSQTPTEDGNIQPWCSATLKEQSWHGFLLQGFVFLEQNVQNLKLEVFLDLVGHRKLAADSPFQTHSLNLILPFFSSLLYSHFSCVTSCCSENPSWTLGWTFPTIFCNNNIEGSCKFVAWGKVMEISLIIIPLERQICG